MKRNKANVGLQKFVWTHVKTLAGIIWDSGAASIRDCHVLVEFGMTNPNSKNHSAQRDAGKELSTALLTCNSVLIHHNTWNSASQPFIRSTGNQQHKHVVMMWFPVGSQGAACNHNSYQQGPWDRNMKIKKKQWHSHLLKKLEMTVLIFSNLPLITLHDR